MRIVRSGAAAVGLLAALLAGCAAPAGPASVTVVSSVPTVSSPTSSARPLGSSAPPSVSVAVKRTSGEPQPATSGVASAMPQCPGKLSLTGAGIPKPPSTITADRVLPAGTVRSALMCVYVGTNMDSDAGLPLAHRANLQGDLAAMAAELRWLPPDVPGQQHSCTDVGGPQTNFLVAVSFADGRTSWLGTADDPNGCVGTAGSISSSWTTGPRFLAALKTGRWQPAKAVDGGSCSGQARFGQQSQMVPFGAVSVRICLDLGSKSSQVEVSAGFEALVKALNALPTKASTSNCSFPPVPASATKVPDNPFYRLVFHYRQGPSVEVRIQPGCTPAIDNSSLQATDSSTVVPLLGALMAGR